MAATEAKVRPYTMLDHLFRLGLNVSTLGQVNGASRSDIAEITVKAAS